MNATRELLADCWVGWLVNGLLTECLVGLLAGGIITKQLGDNSRVARVKTNFLLVTCEFFLASKSMFFSAY